jgi:hypothetical protein
MLRAAVLGMAVLVLASACALLPPPQPANTRPIEITIRNNMGRPQEVRITTPSTGEIPGSAVPQVVPAGVLGVPVTLYVPVVGDWNLQVGSRALIPAAEFENYPDCVLGMKLQGGDNYMFGCLSDL